MSLVTTTLQKMGQVSLGVRVRRDIGVDEEETNFPWNTSSAGVRDYIHVVDLAKGHIAALKKLKEQCGCRVGSRERRQGGAGWNPGRR